MCLKKIGPLHVKYLIEYYPDFYLIFCFALSEMYWRILGGGHMLSVESCTLNQTQLMWALGKKFYLKKIS